MVLILAHRGSSAERPENTLSSINTAIDIGVDYIEIDVHLTRDGIPIIIHDPTLQRTTNYLGDLRVEETTIDELKKLDAGSWFDPYYANEKLPTLSEVLSLDFKQSKLMIEIKKDRLPAKALVHAIINTVHEVQGHSTIPDLCFGSFDPEIIKEIKKLAPQVKTVGIMDNVALLDSFLRMKVQALAIWHQIIDVHLINNLKAIELEIWTFTVDDHMRSQQLIEMGIDGLITNNPRSYLFQGNFESRNER